MFRNKLGVDAASRGEKDMKSSSSEKDEVAPTADFLSERKSGEENSDPSLWADAQDAEARKTDTANQEKRTHSLDAGPGAGDRERAEFAALAAVDAAGADDPNETGLALRASLAEVRGEKQRLDMDPGEGLVVRSDIFFWGECCSGEFGFG